jgi:hypothetical protein
MPERVAFICSNHLHVRLFADAIRSISLSSMMEPVVAALYPEQAPRIDQEVRRRGLTVPWLDTVAMRSSAGRLIDRIFDAQSFYYKYFVDQISSADLWVVVLGNDTGHRERAILRACTDVGIQVILVQDGYLFEQYANSWTGNMRLHVSRLWATTLGHFLGGVTYGMGGADVIAALSSASLEVLCRRVPRRKVVLVNHPLQLSPPDPADKLPRGGRILYLGTNYLRGLKSRQAHEDQLAEVVEIARLAKSFGGLNSDVVFKPHPQDDVKIYKRLTDVGISIITGDSLDELITESWFCVSNISSATLDCARLNRICIMTANCLLSEHDDCNLKVPGLLTTSSDEFLAHLQVLHDPQMYRSRLDVQYDVLHDFHRMPDTPSVAALVERLIPLQSDTSR